MEQRRHEDGEYVFYFLCFANELKFFFRWCRWENATGGRRSRSNTGSANAANNTVRQPKGPDGGSRGFGKRWAVRTPNPTKQKNKNPPLCDVNKANNNIKNLTIVIKWQRQSKYIWFSLVRFVWKKIHKLCQVENCFNLFFC